MPENENSTPTESVGVFDHISGARSRDPDVVEEVAPEPQPNPEPGQGAKPPEGAGEDHKIRLNARIADLERQLGELDGVAQLGVAIIQDPEGKKLAERWQKGEPLFQGAQQPPGAQPPGQAERPMTKAELHAELNQREASARQLEDLNSLMGEKHPDFKKIRRNQQYVGRLDACLMAAWNGSLPVAEEAVGWADRGMAKNYTAMKEAYEWTLKQNPKVLDAAKEAGKLEASSRAEAALAGEVSSSSGVSKSSSEGPPKTEEEEILDRMLHARGIGKSFNTVGRG